MGGMRTEVLYVRLPLSLKIELQSIAEEYEVSLARVTARAVELYLLRDCGRSIPESVGGLP
jgi:hypothetical protein